MQANEFLEAKNDLTMRFIPIEGYGRVYTEAAVVALLNEYALNENEQIKQAVLDMKSYAMKNGLLIGECSAWNKIKKLVDIK